MAREYTDFVTNDDPSAKDRKVRTPVVWRCRSERPQWRTFDFCSISTGATDVEVFRLPV
jgi:hypothetical protein